MLSNHKLNLSERTAQHLRDGFNSGRWAGTLPGVSQLAAELAVSRDVLRAALRLLEAEGLVSHQGAGRSRCVAGRSGPKTRRVLRVGMLLPLPPEEDNAHTQLMIFSVRQTIESTGHVVFIAPKSAAHFHGNAARIRRYMADCKADAWIL